MMFIWQKLNKERMKISVIIYFRESKNTGFIIIINYVYEKIIV